MITIAWITVAVSPMLVLCVISAKSKWGTKRVTKSLRFIAPIWAALVSLFWAYFLHKIFVSKSQPPRIPGFLALVGLTIALGFSAFLSLYERRLRDKLSKGE